MIETIITHTCPRYGSANLVKSGCDYKGTQKFRDCQRYGTVKAGGHRVPDVRAIVEKALTERISLRGMARVFGISRTTIPRWLAQMVKQAPALVETLFEGWVDDALGLDELCLWGRKRNSVGCGWLCVNEPVKWWPIERWFNTLRQRLSRFTRKTLSLSRRDDQHENLLWLFLARYNLACIS